MAQHPSSSEVCLEVWSWPWQDSLIDIDVLKNRHRGDVLGIGTDKREISSCYVKIRVFFLQKNGGLVLHMQTNGFGAFLWWQPQVWPGPVCNKVLMDALTAGSSASSPLPPPIVHTPAIQFLYLGPITPFGWKKSHFLQSCACYFLLFMLEMAPVSHPFPTVRISESRRSFNDPSAEKNC